MDLENILNTLQPFLVMFVALLAAFMTATWISSVIWAFRDIRARTRDVFAQILATLMVLIFFPLFPLPGLMLYFILRPRETLAEVYERQLEEEALLKAIEERLACPNCNRGIREEYMVCPACHTRLKKACVGCGQLLHLRWNICPYCGAGQTAAQPVILLPGEESDAPMLEGRLRTPLPEPAVAPEGDRAAPEEGPAEQLWFEDDLDSGPGTEGGTDPDSEPETLPFHHDS
jgi:RNA polymerase subunit RPABC4/transcription elongation factor Spt4